MFYVDEVSIVLFIFVQHGDKKSWKYTAFHIGAETNSKDNRKHLNGDVYFLFFAELMKLLKCIVIWSWEVHWFKTSNWDYYHKNKYMIKSMEFGICQVTRHSEKWDYVDYSNIKMFWLSMFWFCNLRGITLNSVHQLMHVEKLIPCICYSVQQSLFWQHEVYMTLLICKELDTPFLLKRCIYLFKALYHPEGQSCRFQSAPLNICKFTCSFDYSVRLYCPLIIGNWKHWNKNLCLKIWKNKDYKEKIENIYILLQGISCKYFPEPWNKMEAVISACAILVQNGNKIHPNKLKSSFLYTPLAHISTIA